MIPKKDFRIVFMGTPEFAVESLRRLLEHQYPIAAVVTNPDKPAGRGRKVRESAVKTFARAHKLPVLQPSHLKDEGFARELENLNPSLQVVVAFKILPPRIFKIPSHGTFNLHASLLPDYRGAAPINHVLINGEDKTGVTTFFLDERVDTGSIILQKETPISEQDDAGTLHDRLMMLGGDLVVETVEKIRTANYTSLPQNQLIPDDTSPKRAPKIFKDDCRINWSKTSREIYNLIRGLSPYPAAWTSLINTESMTIKVYRASHQLATHSHSPGTLHTDDKSYLKVATQDGYIFLEKIQQAGKKKMPVEEFLKGFRNIRAYRCS